MELGEGGIGLQAPNSVIAEPLVEGSHQWRMAPVYPRQSAVLRSHVEA